MFILYIDYNAENVRAYCWGNRPIWWDYEGTNFVRRGTNMLRAALYRDDTLELKTHLFDDPYKDSHDTAKGTKLVHVTSAGFYTIDHIQIVPASVLCEEKFNSLQFYDDEDSTGQNRECKDECWVLAAILQGSTPKNLQYITLGIFTNNNDAVNALEDFCENVVSKASNNVVHLKELPKWRDRHSYENVTNAAALLKSRGCIMKDGEERFVGKYYGADITRFPPNYVQNEDGSYTFHGSDEALYRYSDTGDVTTLKERLKQTGGSDPDAPVNTGDEKLPNLIDILYPDDLDAKIKNAFSWE